MADFHPHVRKQGPSRGAFTLIELLVTIGIIAILMAIIFPVLGSLRERGDSVACVSSLRNLGVVMAQFRGERNQRMWDLNPTSDSFDGSQVPAEIFYRMGLIESSKEMLCPSAETAATGALKIGGSSAIANEFSSYIVNGFAFYTSGPTGTYWPSIKYPAPTSFLYFSNGESKTPSFMDGMKSSQLNWNSWQPDMRLTRLSLRHQGRCNVLFLDGHVGSLDHEGLVKLDPFGGNNPDWKAAYGLD